MDKVELQKVILEKIGSDSEESFLEFLKRIAEYLQGYKTLKLDNVGHFQLKKEPLSRMERRGEESEKDIIVFLPDGENGAENLLTFEVKNDVSSSSEFSDSVFDIGVDKPTVIPNSEIANEEVGNKILTLIESGNVLDNYDIIDNESFYTKTSNDDENIEFATSEIVGNSEDSSARGITEVQINENFLSESEEDNFNDIKSDEEKIDVTEIENNNFEEELEQDEVESSSDKITIDNFEEVSSNLETKITEDDVAESESEINVVTKVSEEFIAEDVVVEDDDIVETEENIEATDEDKNPFDELDDYIKDETKDEAQEIIDSAPDEIGEVEEIIVAENDADNIEAEEKKETERKSYSALRNKPTEWYKKPVLLIAIFAFLAAVMVIFLSWPSSSSSSVLDAENGVDVNTESGISEHAKVDSIQKNSKIGKDDIKNEKNEQTDAEKLAEVKKIKKENTSKVIKEETKTVSSTRSKASTGKLYRDIPNDQTVTNRIYTDGKKFTVQSSSWKSTSIAEHEVSKLKKRGFDAFIFKVYIKSKGSTWNRVRIGYFNSRKEAEEFLQKNRI